MLNKSIAGAVASALLMSPAVPQAAADDLAQIREQLQGLLRRVDKLEQENIVLKSENETLKAQDDYLKAETRGLRKEAAVAATEIGRVKGADWATRIRLKGDLRYRYEFISDETVNAAGVQATADRYRDRVRGRFNAEVKATDNILVGFGFATTEGGDPRSSNQTLTNVFARKSLNLDLAYFDWKFAGWGHLVGGKMKQPFFKPGQSLYWDNDINPEGLAVNLSRGMFFGSAYGYWINEISGAENTNTADTLLAGAQFGMRTPIGSSSLILALHYYDLAAGQGRSPFFNGVANGNTTMNVGMTPVLVNDYQVVNLDAELNTLIGNYTLQIWADLAQNQDPHDLDEALSGGVIFGEAGNPHPWEVGVGYYSVEKDAVYAQLFDSDFAGGVTDTDGLVVRAEYVLVRNCTLNASYFINNHRNMDVANAVGGKDVHYDRLQLDFNLKF